MTATKTDHNHQAAQNYINQHNQLMQSLQQDLPLHIDILYRKWQETTDTEVRGETALSIAELLYLTYALQDFRDYATQSLSALISHHTRHLRNHTVYQQLNELAESTQVIFNSLITNHAATLWVDHAVLLRQGQEQVSLAAAARDWQEHLKSIATSHPGYFKEAISTHAFTHNPHIPPRDNIKINGKPAKGWQNIRYDPEAGLNAIHDRLHIQEAGNLIVRSRVYPPPTK